MKGTEKVLLLGFSGRYLSALHFMSAITQLNINLTSRGQAWHYMMSANIVHGMYTIPTCLMVNPRDTNKATKHQVHGKVDTPTINH